MVFHFPQYTKISHTFCLDHNIKNNYYLCEAIPNNMKKVISLLLLAVVFTTAYAQKVTGDFRPLKDQVRARLIVDFSDAIIMGMTLEEFADYEEDWEHDKIEVFSLVYNYANEELERTLVVGNYNNDTEYVLHLMVRTIDVRGDYDSDLYLIHNFADGRKETIGKVEGLFARGGRFGTKLNLMKDGAEHTGTALGKLLIKEMNRRPSRK